MKLAAQTSLLVRVLEPEVMDSALEALDYDRMDHGDVNRRFADDFLAAVAGVGGNFAVLDVGTGTAQIPVELCRRDPRAHVTAIDLSGEMLRVARANVDAAGLADRIALEIVDAKGLPYAAGRFAAVMSNSIVHHIPDPRPALAEALRVVASGGVMFVRDLARPYDDRQVRELVTTYAADCNDHQRQLFEASLRAALSIEEMRLLVADLGFDPATLQATSDRHWTWSAIKS